jgi:hypothetical protein
MIERTVQAQELVELARWLQRQADEKRSRVVLRQRASSGNERVREWRLAGIVASDLAGVIYAGAVDDARAQRGMVQYGLFAYLDGQKTHADRLLFCIEAQGDKKRTALATLGDEGDEDDGASLERGQKANLVGLLMRHTHASAQLALGHTVDIVRHYQEESQRKDTRIRELEERHEKVLAMYEELLSMKHERELEMLRAQNSEKRKDHLLEKLDMLVPVAMSKVLPTTKTPALAEELVRQFFKSMSRDQFQAIVGQLSPEQQAVVYEIYIAYGQREENRAKKKANGIHGGGAGAPAPQGDKSP